MATTTIYYGLSKPEASDLVDIGVLNDNFDKIDTQMKTNEDSLPPVATDTVAGIVKPDGVTVMVDEDGTIHGAQTYELPIASDTTLGGVKVGKNLIMTEDGTLNGMDVKFDIDSVPMDGSGNAVMSGGVYTALVAIDKKIESLLNRVNALETQVTSLVTGIVWKRAVDTFDNIATTYSTPEVGWTVTCLDTGKVYQWDGTEWLNIMTSLYPIASEADVLAVLEGLA